jgi:formylglycine-generating enzyme required for sulfatase activity
VTTREIDGTRAVGTRGANPFGLFDMHGNVYEWVADRYGADAYRGGGATDPTGPSSGEEHVLRGGSWESAASNARCANRNGYASASRGYTVGFRVAMSIERR